MKMNNLLKKTMVLFLVAGSSNLVFAHVESSGAPDLSNDEYKNLPQADSGIQIVPYSELSHGGFPLIDGLQRHIEQKKNGFVKKISADAAALLPLNKNDKSLYVNNDNPHDTHMKTNVEKMKLAFPFKAITFIHASHLIGFAPEGSWKNGWTGIGEFFIDNNIGTCNYIKHNFIIAHGGAKLAQEFITYDINQKPTIIVVEGQKDHGFSYKVDWFDNEYFHTLICASKDFSKDKTLATIELAKRIDTDQS